MLSTRLNVILQYVSYKKKKNVFIDNKMYEYICMDKCICIKNLLFVTDFKAVTYL